MKNNIFSKINIDNLISENDTVLIALSGGADSIFLAEYLLSIKEKYSLNLVSAHIEHGIRGEESLLDCKFVEDYCKNNGIECHTLHIDAINESKEMGVGVEEYSRNRRYEFFNSIECDKIATAHNLTDNEETLLFRLIRGTSINGLCAIPEIRGKIIRPLLNISGEEIRKYLDENGITYCVDSTNFCNDYKRNHIRNNILPLFGEINSDYVGSLGRFISSVKEDCDFLNIEADKAFKACLADDLLNLNVLRNYHISIQKRVIIRYFQKNQITLDELHLNEVVSLIHTPSRVQISGSLYAVSNKNSLRLVDYSKNGNNVTFNFEKEKMSVNDFLNKCELFSEKFDFCCDCDKIVGTVSVRARENGDRIAPANRACTKSINKLFNEFAVPAEIRGSIPVVTDDNGIIGVYGFCVDERVKITDNTKNVLIVNVFTEDNN